MFIIVNLDIYIDHDDCIAALRLRFVSRVRIAMKIWDSSFRNSTRPDHVTTDHEDG